MKKVYKPLISIIIPTYKRRKFLEEALLSIIKNDFKEKEVIVVNDDPQTNLLEVYEKYSPKLDIKIFFNEEQKGPISARNLGAKKAKANLICFLDDDMTVSENWCQVGYNLFSQNKEIIGVVGKTILPVGDFPHPLKAYFMMEKEGNFPTCNFWVKKEYFLGIGGFDTAFYDDKMKIFHQEDSDLIFRLMEKGKIIFSPELVAYHPSHSFSFFAPIKKSRKAYFDPLLKKRYPSKYSQLTKKCFGSLCISNARVRLRLLSLLLFLTGITTIFKNLTLGVFLIFLFIFSILGNIALIAGFKNIKRLSLKDWVLSFIAYFFALFFFFFYLFKGMVKFRKFFL